MHCGMADLMADEMAGSTCSGSINIPDEVRSAAASSQALKPSASCCSICNEFLEDWHKDQPLLPADPVERAHARMVIDRISSKYVPNFYSFLVRQVRYSCMTA